MAQAPESFLYPVPRASTPQPALPRPSHTGVPQPGLPPEHRAAGLEVSGTRQRAAAETENTKLHPAKETCVCLSLHERSYTHSLALF